MVKLYEEFSNELRVDAEVVDAIRFGYPTAELKGLVSDADPIIKFFVEKGFADEIIKNAPSNSGKTTQQDLKIMKAKMEAVTMEDITFARSAEESLEQMFLDFFRAKGKDVSMLDIQKVVSATDPIVFYLKNLIQRPRPHQLGWYYKAKLYPIIHTDANSAAYPSGHAMSCYTLAKYFGRTMPELQGELDNLAQRIADSRVYCGIHYPSDSEVSAKIANIIFKNNLI
jgi:hypothetical protein